MFLPTIGKFSKSLPLLRVWITDASREQSLTAGGALRTVVCGAE